LQSQKKSESLSENNLKQKGWRPGASGKVPAYQSPGPEFNPQYCQVFVFVEQKSQNLIMYVY
jgi:hypothetical protein